MEGQSSILKTFLIAAVIYTLTFGAPVKRDTENVIDKTCKAARRLYNLTIPCETAMQCACSDLEETNYAPSPRKIAEKLISSTFNFTAAVREAVEICVNSSGPQQTKCTVAIAAITLQDMIKRFIGESNTDQILNQKEIDCSGNKTEVNAEMNEQTLCEASWCTMKCLRKLENNEDSQTISCDI